MTIVIIVIRISTRVSLGLLLLVLEGAALAIVLLLARLLAFPRARYVSLEAERARHAFELEEKTAGIAENGS